MGIISNNPILNNITDYLIEEASAEEEELLGKNNDLEVSLFDILETISIVENFRVNVIVENYTNSKTVEQKAMFTLYKATVKLMFTLYNNIIIKSSQSVNMSFTQHFIKCEHEFYSTLCKM